MHDGPSTNRSVPPQTAAPNQSGPVHGLSDGEAVDTRRERTLCPTRSRIFLMPYRIIVGLSSDSCAVAEHRKRDGAMARQTYTPAQRSHVLRETHRLQHLWPEHAAVANLDPLAETWMVGEDLEGWLCEPQTPAPLRDIERARTSV